MILTPDIDHLVQKMKRHARTGIYDGQHVTRYLERARQFHSDSGTVLLFTRDSGMHTGGWFKNPDYERCYHLSISFRDPASFETTPFDFKLAQFWGQAFYETWTRYVWSEGPFSEEGKLREVHHYRVFCNDFWQPIIPRGEVYSKEFTEMGWKSWSELHDQPNNWEIWGQELKD